MYLSFFFFVSPLVLRAPSTDRPETLPHGRNLNEFIIPLEKFGGRSPKKIWGPKTCKISVNFGPLQTSTANISGTAKDIRNRPALQTMAITPAFNGKGQVNFGPCEFGPAKNALFWHTISRPLVGAAP